MRKEDASLNGIADISPKLRLIPVPYIFSIYQNVSLRGGKKTVHHLQGCSFAAAGRADDGDELSLFNGQIQILQDHLVSIGFFYMPKLNDCLHLPIPPLSLLFQKPAGIQELLCHIPGLPSFRLYLIIHLRHIIV